MTDKEQGKRIKELRLSLGMTQSTLACRVGVSRGTIWVWESNGTPICKDKYATRAQRLAHVLNTTPEYILEGTKRLFNSDKDILYTEDTSGVRKPFGGAQDRATQQSPKPYTHTQPGYGDQLRNAFPRKELTLKDVHESLYSEIIKVHHAIEKERRIDLMRTILLFIAFGYLIFTAIYGV